MTEPRDPVPGTGRHGKGGADRKTRIKHGAALLDPKQAAIKAKRGAAAAREPAARMSTPAAWAFVLAAVLACAIGVIGSCR